MSKQNRPTVQGSNALKEKWGSGLSDGFVPVPITLLNRLGDLKISTAELSVLIALLSFWHEKAMPYALLETICKRCPQSSISAVRKHLGSLETKHLINRVYRKNRSTVYDLKPLVLALNSKPASSLTTPKRVLNLEESSGRDRARSSGRIDSRINNIKNETQAIGDIVKQRYGSRYGNLIAIVLVQSLIISVIS